MFIDQRSGRCYIKLMDGSGCLPPVQRAFAMTTSRQEARQSLISFLAAVPVTALALWATYGLATFVA